MEKPNKEELIEELKKKINEEGNLRIFCYKGITAVIKRPYFLAVGADEKIDSEHSIYLTGYAMIPENTKLARLLWENIREVENSISVHGGITYSEIEDGFLIIGFDCAHSGDIRDLDIINTDSTYKDMKFTEQELKSMIDQLLEFGGKCLLKEEVSE